MEKIMLGNTLSVSKIGLGAINFGTKTAEEQAFTLLDEYVNLGGNFIDTANNYAVWNGGDGGESERTIGKWLNQSKQREHVVLATKLGALTTGSDTQGLSQMEGLGRETMRRSVERSLNHLQVSSIDLLYLHVDDFSTPQEEVMGTLAGFVEEGIVKEIGCSNFYSWRLESARQICEQHGWPFFCALQQRHSYLAPVSDAELYPQVALNEDMKSYLNHHKALKLVAYSPMLRGQYSTSDIKIPAYDTAGNREKLARLLAEEKQPNRWVLDYLTQEFGGSIALVTTSSTAHLREVMSEEA